MIRETNFLDRLPNGWRPKSHAQKMALTCPAEFLCYGGSVGSLKSETVLMDALKYRENPKYAAVIIRRTYPEMEQLIGRTRDLYSNTGAQFLEGPKIWRWPWGATVAFRFLDKPKDVHKMQGFEYQYIAFDESTHQPEFPVRYLLNSRMRSVNNIPLRMRLATNPGNIGADWHKQIFHGKRCIHCMLKKDSQTANWPSGQRKYGELYFDVKWPSDGVSINHSTCFIPGKVTDHNLFGEGGGEYMKKLRGLPAALQDALLHGCWEAFEGQYFDCFDFNLHIVDREAIDERPWWPYWVGMDYGFKHATVAYLFTKAPDNTVYVLAEYGPIKGRKGIDVAKDVQLLWGRDVKYKALYLSPDTFSHDGKTDFSQAEMMVQETRDPYEMAYNDRISGWLLCYQLLQNGRMFISRDCPALIDAIPTRIHSEKDDGDIEKVETDADDAADAWRYGVASEIRPGERPEDELIQEKIDSGEWGTDPTSVMMNRMLYENFHRKDDGPFSYRQRGRTTKRASTSSIFRIN